MSDRRATQAQILEDAAVAPPAQEPTDRDTCGCGHVRAVHATGQCIGRKLERGSEVLALADTGDPTCAPDDSRPCRCSGFWTWQEKPVAPAQEPETPNPKTLSTLDAQGRYLYIPDPPKAVCECGDFESEHDAEGCKTCRQSAHTQLFPVCREFREVIRANAPTHAAPSPSDVEQARNDHFDAAYSYAQTYSTRGFHDAYVRLVLTANDLIAAVRQEQAAEIERLTKELATEREWVELLSRGKSPCGHWKAYAVTDDPKGASISCLQCRAERAEAALAKPSS